MRIFLREFFLMGGSRVFARSWVPVLILAGALASVDWAQQPSKPPTPANARLEHAAVKQLVTQHCTNCHNSEDKRAGLALYLIIAQDVAAHPDVWEKVVRKLTARQMPPIGKPRPDERAYESVVASLEAALDRAAAARPNPGRTATLRRLNRTEY